MALLRYALAVLLACVSRAAAAQEATIVIRAGTVIDGEGGVQRNAAVVVREGRIVKIEPGAANATYDLSRFTVLPGLIDSHVHIASHFGKDGRIAGSGETPARSRIPGRARGRA